MPNQFKQMKLTNSGILKLKYIIWISKRKYWI